MFPLYYLFLIMNLVFVTDLTPKKWGPTRMIPADTKVYSAIVSR